MNTDSCWGVQCVLSVICVSSVSICGWFSLARAERDLTVRYVGNTLDSLRFEDRRQRHFYALRCRAQLGAKEFALANADGSRLLRDRTNGDGRITV